MPLGKHTKNPVTKRFRQERSDTKIETLKKEYPILSKINGNTHLGTLKEKLGAPSLDKVLEALRKKK